MKIAILDAATLGKDADLKIFEEFGSLRIFETTSKDELIENLKDCEIIIINKVKIDKEAMTLTPSLKLICITATGTDNVDLIAAKKLGIEVKNVAGYSTASVAQHTLALVLHFYSKVGYYGGFVKNKGWLNSKIFTHLNEPINEISGKEWGIVGFGKIGQEVAKIAKAFGANVSYYSTSGKNSNSDFPSLSLKELLTKSQIVTIHAPLNAQTRGLISKNELAYMPQDALLVNVGRGGIVDESALKDAILNEKIFVALDVLEKEPMSQDSALMELLENSRVLITPHVAWASVEARERLMGKVKENIENFLKDR